MKVLVIAGYCLKVNSSANICHLKYIDGLRQLGYEVELLTASEKGHEIDPSMPFPSDIAVYQFDSSLYERIGYYRRTTAHKQEHQEKNQPIETKITTNKHLLNIKQMKNFLLNLYGPHRLDAGWLKRAKVYRSKTVYDLVLSLSSPPASHALAEFLIRKRRITCNKWIQIWEDPWYGEMFGYQAVKRTNIIWKEEHRILKSAEKMYYVSPLTLMYQKQLFPDCADKMNWQPLPSYYEGKNERVSFQKLHFGYFGDYYAKNRNLRPFYDTAIDLGLDVTICGSSDECLASTERIDVHPRLSLSELHQYEDKTNVLVFLCNRKLGQIPGKIYQYSATNKLILFILDGTENEKQILKEFFGSFNRYCFCDNKVDDIKRTICRMQNHELEGVRVDALDDFSPSNIVKNILEG